MSSGFRDKLYWRQVNDGLYHCFEKTIFTQSPFGSPGPKRRKGYLSICGGHERRKSGGQRCGRPEAYQRCAVCDREEMELRGWLESGPTSPKEG